MSLTLPGVDPASVFGSLPVSITTPAWLSGKPLHWESTQHWDANVLFREYLHASHSFLNNLWGYAFRPHARMVFLGTLQAQKNGTTY